MNITKKRDLKEHPSYTSIEGRIKYKLKNLTLPKRYKTNLKIRLTVDTPEDLKLAKIVFQSLEKIISILLKK